MARRPRHRLEHELRREAHHAALVVHVGAVLLEERRARAASRSARRRARGSAGSPASDALAPRRRAAQTHGAADGLDGWALGGCHDLLLGSGPVCQTIRRPAPAGKRGAGRLRSLGQVPSERRAGAGRPSTSPRSDRRSSTRVAIVTLSPVRLCLTIGPVVRLVLYDIPDEAALRAALVQHAQTRTAVRAVRDARPHRSGTPAGAASCAGVGRVADAGLALGRRRVVAADRGHGGAASPRLPRHPLAGARSAWPSPSLRTSSPPGRWAARTLRPSIWKTQAGCSLGPIARRPPRLHRTRAAQPGCSRWSRTTWTTCSGRRWAIAGGRCAYWPPPGPARRRR